MGKIVTLKDRITQKSIYPVTTIDAIIVDESGSTIESEIEKKFKELESITGSAVMRAREAYNTAASLKNLNEGLVKDELDKLNTLLDESIQQLTLLKSSYNELNKKTKTLIKTEDVIQEVTKESNKIPTSNAIINYISEKTDEIINYLIDTTTVIPNYIPKTRGQILINTQNNFLYISPNNSKTWYGIESTPLQLNVGEIYGIVDSVELELIGDTAIENKTLIINNEVELEGSTLIIPKKFIEIVGDIIRNTLRLYGTTQDNGTLFLNDSSKIVGNTLIIKIAPNTDTDSEVITETNTLITPKSSVIEKTEESSKLILSNNTDVVGGKLVL